MQLLQRTSYSSPVVNPLLIFCGFCAFTHLIHFVYITSCVSVGCANVATFWISTWTIARGAGSYSLLLTFLCIKFQDTNSMSVPRRNFSKLHSLLKQNSSSKASIPSKKGTKKKRKKAVGKGKKRKKHGSPVPQKDGFNKLTKSGNNFLPSIPTSSYSSISSTTDHAGIKNNSSPPINIQHSNLLSDRYKDNKNATFSTTNKGGQSGVKRKSVRRGKHANEFPSSYHPSPSSRISWKEDALMNQNEGEALRRKILAKVEELDPLMCLPKVLCGYSSRRRLKKYPPKTTTTSTTTSTTHRPILAGGIIDEYLHLLGIIPSVKSEDENLKEVKKQVKPKKKIQKDGKKRKEKPQQTKRKRKKSQEEDEYTQQSGSGSSSGESDESAQFQRYPPIRQRRPYREKFLFNRNKDEEDNEENDIDEDDEESAEQDDENDDLLDDEEVKYVIEKAKMEKLMASGSHSDENWWDPFDEQKIYQKTMSSYYMAPPPDPSYDPLAADDILGGESGGGITGWFSNMFSNIMPSMSWGGGGKKDEDDFKSDPFFTSFDGRSMKNGETRSFSSSNNFFNDLKMPTLSSANYLRNSRKGKQVDLQNYFGVRVNSKQLDYVPGKYQEDPVAKYRIAVEIGSRAKNPSQCDFVYNGCPLAYEEILAIINEPLRHKPSTTKAPTTTTKKTSSSQNFITPPPRQIVVPLHQQEQRFPLRPHYQNGYSQQPHRQFYNQQYQQPQQYHPPFILQNHQFHQQPGLYSTSDGILAQVAKPNRDHKTKIHQALPSGNGEVEINLSYSTEKKSGLPQGVETESNNLYIAPEMNTEENFEGFGYPHYATSSVSASFEHSQQTDPFSHKVLTYPQYEFFPKSNGYKIRRKNQEIDKSVADEDVKAVSSSVDGGSSIFMSESSYENSNNKEKSPSVPEKDLKKREQRIPSRVTYNNKGKDKRKHMLKDTYSPSPSSSPSSSPPLRQSPYRQRILPPPQQQAASQKKKKGNGNNKKGIMRKKYVKEKQENEGKKKRKNKGTRNDNNRSSNNSDDDGGISSSNEQFERYGKRRLVRRKEYPNDSMKRRMKRKRKLHLHKQSSESIEAKKRRKIGSPNAIYPVYGHPFPPPYAGYYHTLYPSTPTSPSFFSYFFGR